MTHLRIWRGVLGLIVPGAEVWEVMWECCDAWFGDIAGEVWEWYDVMG